MWPQHATNHATSSVCRDCDDIDDILQEWMVMISYRVSGGVEKT